ncbi:hypothetical protein NC796_07615 [Aliifodinibius sp. S!AR15-10]|uniref:hypothetical protein n=1 Tax=Aliifodinibius sp. S!AR15-10 TaxID=2950437 RepID=UPI00285FEE5C|nr:hypothetical protein [Aliifodinibius sp. S!AR15-10]MDR8390999.1 hypothetical protein [Aliifodinibius sp. S!AR15-10]
MIEYIKINDKEYPIKFSFRAVFSYMNGSNVETLEDANTEVLLNFDSLLKLFEQAFKKGAKKDNDFDGKPLTADEIEDAIDEEPSLFIKLQETFNNSKVMKAFAGEELADKKK